MYQPKIRDENIRRLYQLRLEKKKPMTHVLDEILNNYFDCRQKKKIELERTTKCQKYSLCNNVLP
jgi:hypothetical protein